MFSRKACMGLHFDFSESESRLASDLISFCDKEHKRLIEENYEEHKNFEKFILLPVRKLIESKLYANCIEVLAKELLLQLNKKGFLRKYLDVELDGFFTKTAFFEKAEEYRAVVGVFSDFDYAAGWKIGFSLGCLNKVENEEIVETTTTFNFFIADEKENSVVFHETDVSELEKLYNSNENWMKKELSVWESVLETLEFRFNF